MCKVQCASATCNVRGATCRATCNVQCAVQRAMCNVLCNVLFAMCDVNVPRSRALSRCTWVRACCPLHMGPWHARPTARCTSHGTMHGTLHVARHVARRTARCTARCTSHGTLHVARRTARCTSHGTLHLARCTARCTSHVALSTRTLHVARCTLHVVTRSSIYSPSLPPWASTTERRLPGRTRRRRRGPRLRDASRAPATSGRPIPARVRNRGVPGEPA